MPFLKMMQSDGFKKTGCYNINCPGFVQTHPGNYLGSRVENTSIYGGTMIEFDIFIFQVGYVYSMIFFTKK